MKFSEKLENLRKSKGMSQDALAQKLNVTRQTISKWELDQTVPDMNKLVEISKIFDISLDELVNDVEISDSETTYRESAVEKNNKKISIKIFIIGLIFSLILCGIGFIRQNNAKKINEKRYNQASDQLQITLDNAKTRYNEINNEMDLLKEQINAMKIEVSNLQNESINIFHQDRGYSDRYNAKNNELIQKRSELSDLQNQYNNLDSEAFQLQNETFTVNYDLVEPLTYLLFYYIAAGLFGVTIITSLIYFLVTRRKK